MLNEWYPNSNNQVESPLLDKYVYASKHKSHWKDKVIEAKENLRVI